MQVCGQVVPVGTRGIPVGAINGIDDGNPGRCFVQCIIPVGVIRGIDGGNPGRSCAVHNPGRELELSERIIPTGCGGMVPTGIIFVFVPTGCMLFS